MSTFRGQVGCRGADSDATAHPSVGLFVFISPPPGSKSPISRASAEKGPPMRNERKIGPPMIISLKESNQLPH